MPLTTLHRTIAKASASKSEESATVPTGTVADTSADEVLSDGGGLAAYDHTEAAPDGDEEPDDGLPVEQRAAEPKVVDKREGKDGVKRPAEQLTKSQLADRKREVRDLPTFSPPG